MVWKHEEKFRSRLMQLFENKDVERIKQTFDQDQLLSVRVNTLKADPAEIEKEWKEENVFFERLSWCPYAYLLPEATRTQIHDWPMYQKGCIYPQSLSSILAAWLLSPQPEERVLDLCAAPGSKTSLMAMLMENKGHIVAVDPIKNRFYRLQSVLEQLGVNNVEVVLKDGRQLRDTLQFDRVMVDAPCSSESRIKFHKPKTYGYWSERKIKEMAHKQKGLLLNASRLLKPGGTLLYATCTFAPEENESVVSWVLRKNPDIALQPLEMPSEIEYKQGLPEWKERLFHRDIGKCVRIIPTEMMDGFFLAKFVKTT